ncbi:hypothetical protein CVT24_002039 [Panaeolus cyanescens]|uniref:AMP-activated protein kinase glycogen-binding domain-containing protein n=1 Tax=Panaeolus cyanescens TaxID=181874 RepID=A0A409YHL3_9AGAR|nr:hypothetical protein CVT24_002039 [Panaeolus cyanescens]
MSSSNQYELEFVWPSTEPKTVIVSGTFDNWTSSLPLQKTSTGFAVTTRVPWGEKVKYKFIVDGQWLVRDDRPTEVDFGGYVNNVLVTPPKPTTMENGHANGHAAGVNGTAKPLNGDAKPHSAQSPELANGNGFLSDLAGTIAARDGTTTALGYVASGIGAAVHNVVGVDPINTQKIAIPTPKTDETFKLPEGQEPKAADLSPPESPSLETSSESPVSPVAPIVPIMIVPVNAPENNTIPRETFTPDIDSNVQIPVISKVSSPPAVVETHASDKENPSTLATVDKVLTAETAATEQSVVPGTTNVESVPATAETLLAPAIAEEVPAPIVVDDTPPKEPATLQVEPKTETPTTQAETATEENTKPEVPVATVPVVVESKEASAEPVPPTEAVKVEEPKELADATTLLPVSETQPTPAEIVSPPTPVHKPSTPEPTTPTKNKFPTASPSPTSSPASSKFGSTKRRKRSSILGKIKHILHIDNEKEEKVKK